MNLGCHAPVRAAVSGRQLLAQSSQIRVSLLKHSSTTIQHFPCRLDNTSIPDTFSSQRPLPKLSPGRRHLLHNGVEDGSTAAGTDFAQQPSQCIPCPSPKSREHMARVFMLQCRTRARPTSAPDSMRKPAALYARQYSGLAEAQPDLSDAITTVRKVIKQGGRAYADASMVKTHGQQPKLELRLVRDQISITDIDAHETVDETPKPRTVVYEVEVPEIRSTSRVFWTELGVATAAKVKRGVEFQMRKEGAPLSVSWSNVLERLEEYTPPMKGNQVRLTLSGMEPDLVELYYTLLSDPTYDVVLDYPTSIEGQCLLLMAGTTKDIADVIKLVKNDGEWSRLRVGAKQYTAPTSKPTIEGDTPTVHGATNPKTPSILDQLRRPKRWTKKGLADFIRAVAISRPAEFLHQGTKHEDIVEKIFQELIYNSPEVRPYMSWYALHEVLTFFVKHGKTRVANDLLGHMERIGFMPNVDTFNIFLGGCAREQNMYAFNHYLNLMQGEGIRPDEGSWVALMTGAPTVEAAQLIETKLFQRGFAAIPVFARQNAPQVVPYSFSPFLDAGGTLGDYIKTLDDLYGPHWLHAPAVNELIATLATRGRFIEAVDLLQALFLTRGHLPTTGNIHILLRHCARHANADLAIWLLVYARRTWATNSFDHVIADLLFDVAWKSRMLNVVRVVWKYTNAAGEATFRMRRAVHASLQSRLKPIPGTVLGTWQLTAGSVACGIDSLSPGSLSPEAIVQGEKQLYGRTPEFAFTAKLVEAFLADKQWSAANVRRTRDVTWKVRFAVSVPFKPVLGGVLKELLGAEEEGGRRRRGSVRRFKRDQRSGLLYAEKEQDQDGGGTRW